MMERYFLKSAKISLVLVYLVIFAGAFVRLTGSGMGCPDWPKCFGYYIPPTEESELFFAAGKEYDKGQVIIKEEVLLVAKSDFTSIGTFNPADWEKYTKHDYAIFNAWHTWIEYVNRLLGALAGIACFVTLLLSVNYWKENKMLTINSFVICLLMGFQAWLGKTVVDSVLNPFKITTHMLAALLIVALQLYLIFSIVKYKIKYVFNNKFNSVLWLSLGLTIIQIVLGTTVREHVDAVSETGLPEVFWLQNPTLSFYIHRSFSLVVLLTNSYLLYMNSNFILGFKKLNWVLLLLIIEIISGISMYYFDFPFGTQTIHIVLATILFGLQFYLLLESNFAKNSGIKST
jgi:cytochrome c oxidase assembly protein subunit 15